MSFRYLTQRTTLSATGSRELGKNLAARLSHPFSVFCIRNKARAGNVGACGGVVFLKGNQMTDRKTPPPTPPETEPSDPADDLDSANPELKREMKRPSKTVEEMSEKEKGLPPGAKTAWN
jgi:hypothetical protein